ncbi:hypothetical protein L6452_33375 [Arctium lappa]|uniref:Uncharacterized protein n=1 Tax=Arctium lappa TaxID=4217 RepID=A0ACB8YFB3_ARCLA|nr:hypothetical protein L6452_33375 [Arctium lappa]
MEGFSWDAPYYNTFDYSWEQHPNFLANIQDDGTYTSFSPPYQDWNDTFINTLDQSWEENFDYSCDFQGSDPLYVFTSFVPNYMPENYFEQPEPSHSFETFSPSLMEDFTTFLGNFTSSFEALNIKMGQLVDELKNQSQGPLPSDSENFKCVGKDESDEKKELEIFETNFEHMSKPSLLSNSEEVLQDAKIPNLIIFAHVVQLSFCDNNDPMVVAKQIVGRICMIKSSEILHRSCYLGDGVVARSFGMVGWLLS